MLPSYYEFYNPVKIISGHKALDNLPYELDQLGVKRPLVITDQGVVNAGLHPLLATLRRWDYAAAQRVDHFVAISMEVQKRIKTIYDRESVVIYPPVDTSAFTSDPAIPVVDEDKVVPAAAHLTECKLFHESDLFGARLPTPRTRRLP